MQNELSSILNRINELGCADSNCWISGPARGLHTNGGCHCLDCIPDRTERRKIREAFYFYQKVLRILRDNSAQPLQGSPADPVPEVAKFLQENPNVIL